MTREPLGFWISAAKHSPPLSQMLLPRQQSGEVFVDDELFQELQKLADLCEQYAWFSQHARNFLVNQKSSDEGILLHTADPKNSDLSRRALIVSEWLHLGLETSHIEHVAKQLRWSKISPLMSQSSPRSSTLKVVLKKSVKEQILKECEPAHQELIGLAAAEH